MTLSQRYVSKELTHFVGSSLRGKPCYEEKQYSLLVKIIRSCTLKPSADSPEGLYAQAIGNIDPRPLSSNEAYYPFCVCFCDIPQDSLGIHMAKYSRFGLSFLKPFLVKQGVHPMFYIPNNSQVRLPNSVYEALGKPANLADAFDGFWGVYNRLQQLAGHPTALNAEAGKLIETVDMFLAFSTLPYLKFFDDELPESAANNFYMEREWRVLGPVRFELNDIHRITLPAAFETRFRYDFPKYTSNLSCPARENKP